MDGFAIQKEIQNNCEELRDTLIDISKWEKEMKEKEQKLMHSSQDEKAPPVRSLNPQQAKPRTSVNAIKSDEIIPHNSGGNGALELKERADKCKEKGNSHVKLGEYEKAIYCYNDAINILNTDPIFYTNRALCYLKLERYLECIEDCNRAVKLNSKSVKAYYRRMQAYESLGENEAALGDCKNILEIEGKNVEAVRSLDRIKGKIEKGKVVGKSNRSHGIVIKPTGRPTFSELKNNMKIVKTINKPAHLRSKKALKRIAIEETACLPPGNEKDSKNVENSSIASSNSSQISDEVIEKLFNSNEYANYKQVHKKKTPEAPKLNKHPPSESESHTLPSAPLSTGQFYVTWKELSPQNKYFYLRNIEPSNINKILGAGLDSETFSDLLGVLSEYYVKQQVDVHKVLLELSQHNEVAILSLFLSEDDRAALTKLIAYMQERKDSAEDVAFIKSKFNL